MPAIQSQPAANVRLGDLVTRHRAEALHTGPVEAIPTTPNAHFTNLVVACTRCNETEIWRLGSTDLVTTERNPAVYAGASALAAARTSK